jgi:hypothetical protein
MTALSSSTHIETESQPPLQNEIAGKLGAEAFNNPTEFLSVLKNNFNEISGGAKQINLPDLEFEETRGSTAKIREASTIAADHINALGGISAQDALNGPSTQDLEKMDAAGVPANNGGEVISMKDLDFALDMSQGKTFWHTADHLAEDTEPIAVGVMGIGVAGLTAALGVGTEFGAPVALPVAGFIGASSIALLGIGGYAMDKDSQRFPEISKQDTAMINSWLKPGS